MTQAFNLALLANAVDTSGRLNVGTNATGTLPIANGGTGTTTPSLVAGTNISITGSWPNQTITNTASAGGVTSINGQTGAVTTTNIDSIGTTIVAVHAVTANANSSAVSINQNDTVAGSSLRYGYTASTDFLVLAIAYTTSQGQGGNVNIAYGRGGTAPAGTWRCVGRRAGWQNLFDSDSNSSSAAWYPGIFVRIS